VPLADGGRPRHQIVRSHEVQEPARSVRVAAERDADAGAGFRRATALLERMRRDGLRLVVASSARAEELLRMSVALLDNCQLECY